MNICDNDTLLRCSSMGGVDADGLCPVTREPCEHPHRDDPGADVSAELKSTHYPAKHSDRDWTLNRRWDRAARLFQEQGMERLAKAKVTVFGLGGVGSFAAEALARSAVGHLKLVDFDKVCATNVNRQLQAMKGTVGKPKCQVLAQRCRLINPEGEITAVEAFYHPETSEELLADEPDFVIDAIDNVTAKMHLLLTCREREIPVVSCMGAAGKLDPTQIQVADLCATHSDPLARDLRKWLRRNHGMDTQNPTGILAVFSPEPRVGPFPPSYDEGTGFRCICPGGENEFHTCSERNLIDGTAAFVTGAFGFATASVAIRALLGLPVLAPGD